MTTIEDIISAQAVAVDLHARSDGTFAELQTAMIYLQLKRIADGIEKLAHVIDINGVTPLNP